MEDPVEDEPCQYHAVSTSPLNPLFIQKLGDEYMDIEEAKPPYI